MGDKDGLNAFSTFCFAKRWSQKATTAKALGPRHTGYRTIGSGRAALAVDTRARSLPRAAAANRLQ